MIIINDIQQANLKSNYREIPFPAKKTVVTGLDFDYSAFVEAIKKNNPRIVAFSGFLNTMLANIHEYIMATKETDQ